MHFKYLFLYTYKHHFHPSSKASFCIKWSTSEKYTTGPNLENSWIQGTHPQKIFLQDNPYKYSSGNSEEVMA